MKGTIEDYKKQCRLITEAAEQWRTTVSENARKWGPRFHNSRKLLRLYNALMQFEPDPILKYNLILDAWCDFKGAAMRACQTGFDTWGDIERTAAAGNLMCQTLIDLKKAIEVKELLDEAHG